MTIVILFLLFRVLYCEIFFRFGLNCSNTNELNKKIIRNIGCSVDDGKSLCNRMSLLSINDRIEIVKRLKEKGEAFYYGNNRKRYQITCINNNEENATFKLND
jgi:hypothetical protein